MKKIVYLLILMLLIIIFIPLVIVKSCNITDTGGELFPPDFIQSPETNVQDTLVKVLFKDEKVIKEVELEEYIKGVVAAEMPAEFSLEALKAQAVAARTYAYARKNRMYVSSTAPHDEADVCTDSTHCQAWVSKESAMEKWGFLSAFKYWNKIDKAVEETRGIILIHDKKIINPVFHANSGGATENAHEVWNCDQVPYLRSVQSSGEDASSQYQTITIIKYEELYDKLRSQYNNFKADKTKLFEEIKIESYTTGGRVNTIKIGNIIMKGTEFRSLLSLRSANFKLEKADSGTIKITTTGYGHGVGLSQWGANYLAKSGGSYIEILKHYYIGVELIYINEWEDNNIK